MVTKAPGHGSRSFSIHVYMVVCSLNLLGSIHIHMHTHKNSNTEIFWGEDLHGREQMWKGTFHGIF